MKFMPVIGLEIHVELKTATKMFCGCSTSFGAEPNTHCCPVCLGLPGSLPKTNGKALELGIKASLAMQAGVEKISRFDRKNYYYPDLPKAYQISQYDLPLARNGCLEIPGAGGDKKIKIERCHLEEEAGKLIHAGDNILDAEHSLVDYNRAGIPLMEIVTAPDLNSGQEAYLFLNELRLLLLYHGISDCRMEEGSLRCDANISLGQTGSDRLGTRVEVKNMNSFRAVKMAIDFEARRQEKILTGGGEIIQETRHWDENKKVTLPMRGKEEASDYRYFPEPDLPPLHLDESWIEKIKGQLAENPSDLRRRFYEQYRLESKEIEVLISQPNLSYFFEEAAASYSDYPKLAHWITGEILRLVNEQKLSLEEMASSALVETLQLLDKGTINRAVAKEVLEEALLKGKSPETLVSSRNLGKISEEETLLPLIEEVLQENPIACQSYQQGKEKALDFLMGKVMGMTGGRADPPTVKRLVKQKIHQA